MEGGGNENERRKCIGKEGKEGSRERRPGAVIDRLETDVVSDRAIQAVRSVGQTVMAAFTAE